MALHCLEQGLRLAEQGEARQHRPLPTEWKLAFRTRLAKEYKSRGNDDEALDQLAQARHESQRAEPGGFCQAAVEHCRALLLAQMGRFADAHEILSNGAQSTSSKLRLLRRFIPSTGGCIYSTCFACSFLALSPFSGDGGVFFAVETEGNESTAMKSENHEAQLRVSLEWLSEEEATIAEELLSAGYQAFHGEGSLNEGLRRALGEVARKCESSLEQMGIDRHEGCTYVTPRLEEKVGVLLSHWFSAIEALFYSSLSSSDLLTAQAQLVQVCSLHSFLIFLSMCLRATFLLLLFLFFFCFLSAVQAAGHGFRAAFVARRWADTSGGRLVLGTSG